MSPFPRWNRHLSIKVQFENLNDYPRYDFFLHYRLDPDRRDGSGHTTQVFPGNPTLLEGTNIRSLSEVYLVAKPHMNPVPPALQGVNDRDWPTSTVQSAALPGNQGASQLSLEADGYSLSYRVYMEGDQIEVTRVSEEAPTHWGTLIGGGALSVALVAGVLTWLRRSQRAAQP